MDDAEVTLVGGNPTTVFTRRIKIHSSGALRAMGISKGTQDLVWDRRNDADPNRPLAAYGVLSGVVVDRARGKVIKRFKVINYPGVYPRAPRR